jgi:hypothetical protein
MLVVLSQAGEYVSTQKGVRVKNSESELREVKHTLNADVDVVLGLLCLSCIFIGFGEGVCVT